MQKKEKSHNSRTRVFPTAKGQKLFILREYTECSTQWGKEFLNTFLWNFR